jgi:hypothetical protein
MKVIYKITYPNKCGGTSAGTSVVFSVRAASSHAWPAMFTPSEPTRIGFVHANSWIDFATCSTECVRASLAKGLILPMGRTWILI